MNSLTLIAALLLVDLERGGYFKSEKNVSDVIRASKTIANLLYEEAIDDEIKDIQPEYAIAPVSVIVGTAAYQDIAKWTVTKGRIGTLAKVEMACEDYAVSRLRLVVNDVQVWTDMQLPDSLTLSFPNIMMRAGKTTLLQGKTDGAPTLIWGDITGKEV